MLCTNVAGRRRWNAFRTSAVLALAAWGLPGFAPHAAADGHIQQSIVDPTPNSPNSGDEITVKFQAYRMPGPVDTAESRADVAKAKDAFDKAILRSADMRAKVIQAGNGHGRRLNVNLYRRHWNFTLARVPDNTGEIDIDMQDTEAVGNFLTGGTQAKRDRVVKGYLTGVLAHEIEHAKDDSNHTGPDETAHEDPARDESTPGAKGPAVKDENLVISQLPRAWGMSYHREEFQFKDNDGKWKHRYNGGSIVTFNFTDFKNARSRASKSSGGVSDTQYSIDPAALQQIPEQNCEQQPSFCFQRSCGASTADADCDTVDDAVDNCLDFANPHQPDFDGDGQGQGCDLDDDNDGLNDEVETDTGLFVSPDDTGSDPFLADTDGDGVDDGAEVAAGTDPNPSQPPVAPATPALLPAALVVLAAGLMVVAFWQLRRVRSTPQPPT